MADSTTTPTATGPIAITESKKNWLPVESNPDVFNSFSQKLGLNSSMGAFYDLISCDDWAVEMLPRPVYAVLMLYPIKPHSEAFAKEQAARIAAEGQKLSSSTYFMKQKLPNACGTIGAVHAILNASTLTGGAIELDESSWFSRFYKRTVSQTPDERADALEQDKEAESTHVDAVSGGQSDVVEDTWNHFVAFVEKEGDLYELDGRQFGPINHGPIIDKTSGGGAGGSATLGAGAASSSASASEEEKGQVEDLLSSAIRVVKSYMERDPEELRFTMIALCKPGPEE